MSATVLRSIVATALIALASTAGAQDAAEVGRLVTLASQLEMQERFEEAITTYNRTAELCVQIFGLNHKYTGTMYGSSGNLYRRLGRFPEAEKTLQKSLDIFEALGDPYLVAEGVNNLAAVKYELGKYSEALALHRRSVKLFETTSGEGSVVAAVGRSNLAGVLHQLGHSTEAAALYRKSLKTLEANQDTQRKRLADTLSSLANVYLTEGDLARAEPLSKHAVELKEAEFGPDHFEVAYTLNNLATLHGHMGQYARADEELKRSIAIIESTLGPNHVEVARSLTNLARNRIVMDKVPEAEPLYLRALKIREAALGGDHPDVATSLEHLGSYYMIAGRYDDAEAAALRGLKIRENKFGENHLSVSFSLTNLAQLRLRQNRVPEALELFQKARAIRKSTLAADHPDIAAIDMWLGWIAMHEKKADQGVAAFDKSRRSIRHYVEQTLSVLSEPEQIVFLKEIEQPQLHTALSAAVVSKQQQAIDASAGWVLNGKGIAQQVLAERALVNRDAKSPTVAAILETLVAIRKQLASLSLVSTESADEKARRKKIQDLTAREQETAHLVNEVAGRSASRSEYVELDRVRRNIADDAMLVEIVKVQVSDFVDSARRKFPERYVAWIIPPAGDQKVQLVDLGSAEAIDAAITTAREKLTGSLEQIREQGEPDAEAELKKGLQPLAKLVFEPLLAALGDSQKLYLSPDAGLWLVPWGALPLANSKYAVEQFDIRYVISGRDLIPGSGAAVAGTRPILMADPNYDATPKEIQAATLQLFKNRSTAGNLQATPAGKNRLGTAPRLPGTKSEAKAIQPKIESLANTEAYLYTDQWALEAVFKSLRQPQILVISTHGFFRELAAEEAPSAADANPLLRCGLLLAGCNQPVQVASNDDEDGILTGLEIVATDLRGTDLVVLSACETGLGEVRGGEGVAGLRQAFQLAGAKSVVATLWQIPDRETARLMTEFFTQLAEGSDRSAALRQAQLKIIASRRERNEAAHPFFWAAFTITGQ